MKRIILFIKKFFAWILSFFFERNITSKKKKRLGKKVDGKVVKVNSVKSAFSNRDEDMGESHIVDIYPYTEAKDLKSIDELIDELEKKIELINDEKKEEELKTLKEIKEIVKATIPEKKDEKKKEEVVEEKKEEKNDVKEEKPLTVAQEEDIKEVLKEAIEDKELNIDTDEKINNIKKEINEIVDDRLTKQEKDIIEKAYFKYEKVNYVVATTIEIEELEEDIRELQDNLKDNKHKKSYYIDKVKEIEKKINRLKKINKNPKVYEELERLKDDFYTKSIDKYDLLYNKEVFLNLEKQCEDIIDIVNEKEKEVKEEKKEEKEKKEQEREQEKQQRKLEEEKRQLEKEQRRKERQEYLDNIIKRYMDLKKSNMIIMNNALFHHERMRDNDIVAVLLRDYDDLLNEETNDFNFERNKRKTEVCKLYNNLLEVLSNEQHIPFIPVEHINFQYQTLLEDTLSTKEAVEDIAFNKTGRDVMMDPKSVSVADRLDNELKKEKARTIEMGIKDKIIVKEMKN
jgi:hypothetical protein